MAVIQTQALNAVEWDFVRYDISMCNGGLLHLGICRI